MVRWWRMAAVAVALLGTALSGCAGPGTAGGNRVNLGSGTTVTLAAVTNTQAGTGGITGVVVDDAIRPVPGAEVRLGGGLNQTANVTAAGLFTFTDLEPGLYVLRVDGFTEKASGKRYLATQTSAEVKAGEVTKVRFVLAVDRSPVPYHQTMKFDGFYNVGSGFVDEIEDLDVWNHTYGPATTPAPPQCSCRFNFATDGPFVTMVVELQYEETNPMPDGWTFSVKNGGPNPSTLYFCNEGRQRVDPCIYDVNASADGKTYPPGVFNFTIGTWTDPTWVYVNEKFTLYLTFFYVDGAPADYSFVRDGQ